MKNTLKVIIVASLAVALVASCKKDKSSIHVERVSLEESVRLVKGGTLTLEATVLPKDAPNKALDWSSDNKTVATVDKNGMVTAQDVGTANIIATSKDGEKRGTCAVTVTDVEYVEIEANYDGINKTKLKWAKQNLAISVSGWTEWKPDGTEIDVPSSVSGDKVIIGDYFQWGAYKGYCGDSTDVNKGLLTYVSFSCKMCGDTKNSFKFKQAKTFTSDNAPYSIGSGCYIKYTKTESSEGDSRNVLESSDDVARIILGGNWRIPTQKEFEAMQTATYWAWDETDKGCYVYAPNPPEDAGKINEGAGKYYKKDALLFFPAAGWGDNESSAMVHPGSFVRYWSSTGHDTHADDLSVQYDDISHNVHINTKGGTGRFIGYSVRPVSNL